MAFPVSPTNGSTAVVNGIVYLYSSADNAWTRFSSPPGNLTVTSNLTSSGNLIASNLYVSNVLSLGSGLVQQDVLNLNNNNLYNVNTIRINDPGTSEGIAWEGGSGWNIYESPNDLSNNTGNLQIVLSGTRVFTVDTNQAVNIPGTRAATSTTTGALTVGGGVGIEGNLWVGGNIYVSNLVSIGSSTITVQDPLLYLNASSLVPYNYDIGFYSQFIGGTLNNYQHTGLVRNYADNIWGLFSNVQSEPGITIDWTDAGLVWDTLRLGAANISNTTISTSTTTGALTVAGGVGIGGALHIDITGDVSANIGTLFLGNASTQANLGAYQLYANANIGTLFLGNASTQANIAAFYAYANTKIGSNQDGNLVIAATTSSINTTTGALVVGGGAGIAGTINVGGNVAAGNVISSTYYSSAGASKFELTDIGLVTIDVASQQFKFGASGIESSPGIFGGSYGGNKLSLNNETALISNRYDTVTIQTGTDGSTQNTWTFSNSALAAPGRITALGNIVAGSGTTSTSKTTGALVVEGGAGVSGNVYVDRLYSTLGLFWAGNGFAISTGGGGGGSAAGDNGSIQFNDGGTFNGSTIIFDSASGNVVVTDTTDSTSTTTGALVVRGGVGVAGNVFAGKLYTTTGLYWAGNGEAVAGGGLTYTSDTSPHASPALGDQWYDTSTDILYEYIEDGTTEYWVDVQSPIFNGALSTNLVGNLSITGNLSVNRAITATGNITTVANLNVLRSANIHGNILGGNIFVNRNATVASNLTVSGYTILANIVSSGNITNSGNITTTGDVSANNVTVTNAISTGTVTTGNIAAGNLSVSGNVTTGLTVDGTVNAGNLFTTGSLSGNATNTGSLTSTGNVLFTGANVNLGDAANLHITGGSSGLYLQTDGTGNVSWQSLPLTSIQEFTATGGQTVFTIVGTYTVGTVMLFVNGIQMNSADFTATDGTTVVFTVARNAGDTVRIFSSVGASSLSSGLVLSVTNTKNFAVAMSIAMGM
jgi:hypothetical protein